LYVAEGIVAVGLVDIDGVVRRREPAKSIVAVGNGRVVGVPSGDAIHRFQCPYRAVGVPAHGSSVVLAAAR